MVAGILLTRKAYGILPEKHAEIQPIVLRNIYLMPHGGHADDAKGNKRGISESSH